MIVDVAFDLARAAHLHRNAGSNQFVGVRLGFIVQRIRLRSNDEAGASLPGQVLLAGHPAAKVPLGMLLSSEPASPIAKLYDACSRTQCPLHETYG